MSPRRVAPAALIVLLALVLLAIPAAAEIVPNPGAVSGYQEIQISGSALDVDLSEVGPSYALANAYINGVSAGSTVNVTISRPGGSWSGSYRYLHSGVTANISLVLGSASSSWEYLAPVPTGNSFCLRYATDPDEETTGIVLSNVPPFDQDPAKYAYVPIQYLDSLPITRIQASTNTGDEITLKVRYAEAAAVSQSVQSYGQATQTDFLSQLLEAVSGFLAVIVILFAAFKFVFLDHFLAIIVLFESITLAYAASQSNGFIPFVQKFWRYNEAFIFFILKFMSYIVNFFYRIIQAIKPI